MSSKPSTLELPTAEPMPIALRAYTIPSDRSDKPRRHRLWESRLNPSKWTLIFDTETWTDAAQHMRVGVYQLRHEDNLRENGVFYDPQSLSAEEIALLVGWSHRQGFKVHTLAEFIDKVFYVYGYELGGTIVGFNLPFDLSRIAIYHGSARRAMRGGFSFKLSSHRWHPAVQVKHLSARAALIRFAHPSKQLTPRGMRRQGEKVDPHRGYFVDVKTAAAALMSTSHSLASLSRFLGVEHPKLETDGHGEILTEEYLEYATGDVQTTWECYQALRQRYLAHGLTETPFRTIKSEASIGKAYLKQMRVLQWIQVQPDFPPELLGAILSSYYGGRSEVHIRRLLTRIFYCDFLSMYPTVCILMGLWQFVIADGMTWRDSSEETQRLLERVQVGDLQEPEFWLGLRTLVRIRPGRDVLPVRAQYGGEAQHTIGVNHLSGDQRLWFTLADCIASKLLTGRPPMVIEAVSFTPKAPQATLQPIAIGKNSAYQIFPEKDDFYKRVIDLRSEVKGRLKAAKMERRTDDAERLDAEQLALKILANATSYGIFVEVNVEDAGAQETVRCFGAEEGSFDSQTANVERTGPYFHPLLATLITGAARLMLSITERLLLDAGLDWAFCDTDSMAFARPDGMSDVEFLERVEQVRSWFDNLNPYAVKGSLLKAEDANFGLSSNGIEPLYCLAVSAKRYALFNLSDPGSPIIRKASAHGLGHLQAPYTQADPPASIPPPVAELREIGVELWQHDLWYQIIAAVLAGHPDQVDLTFHPALQQPAISRYAATTPRLLEWFRHYNAERAYRDQVRPFGFLSGLQARRTTATGPWTEAGARGRRKSQPVRPIAPFHRKPSIVTQHAFDRTTGLPVPADQLATYLEALRHYHIHPESKFLNGDYVDRGVTKRRHILALDPFYIGKEANRWEEQFHLGMDDDAQIQYGSASSNRQSAEERVREGLRRFCRRAVAKAGRMSLREVSRAAKDPGGLTPQHLARLDITLARMAAIGRRSL